MKHRIGIRIEDKNIWERRVPLVPPDMERLIQRHRMSFLVQPSSIRTYADEEFVAAGALLTEDLSEADVILAVKEVPVELLLPDRAYLFFAHVVKGQSYNMPLLQALLDKKITLIDYEKIEDEQGRRLVFFGRQAGQAGMIETLHALGQRFELERRNTPFAEVRQAYQYDGLDDAMKRISDLGDRIREGLPEELCPLVMGFAGYGNVSLGAQDVFDTLPHKEISPGQLESLFEGKARRDCVYKVVFREEDMVEPAGDHDFELQDYYQHPEKYRGVFSRYLPRLTALVNCIFWTPDYPRLASREDALRLQKSGAPLRVIGDISCDIEGSIEFTSKATEPDVPCFTYDALQDQWDDGVQKTGIAVMAVDILPSEIPKYSSEHFSRTLKNYLPELSLADFRQPLDKLELSPDLKRAIITHRGQLTPDYQYLSEFLEQK